MGEEESVHSLSICFPDRFVILILWLQFFCRKGGTSKSLTLTLPKTNRKPSLIPTPFQWRILFQASNFHVIRQFRGFGAWRLQSFFFWLSRFNTRVVGEDARLACPSTQTYGLMVQKSKKNHWGCKNPGSQCDRPPINWWISKNHQQHDHMTLLRPAEGKKRHVQDWRFNHSCHEWLEIVSFYCKANLKMYQRMKNGSISKRRTTDSLYLEGVFLCQLKNTESWKKAEKLRRKTDLVVQLTRLTQE